MLDLPGCGARCWSALAGTSIVLMMGGCDGLLVRIDPVGGAASAAGDASALVAEPPVVPPSPRDGSIRADGAADPCSPLPAGCRCKAACRAGRCNNARCPCKPIAGAHYAALSTVDPYRGDMSKQPDVNVEIRKTRTCSAKRGLVQINGPTDSRAPQLRTLFSDGRTPTFSAVYQVDRWDWSCRCARGFFTKPEVTMVGLATKAEEVIRAPKSGYDIGQGYTALVIYAAEDTMTLKYTRDDNIVRGYAIHIKGICVEPSLLALYRRAVSSGRKSMPAVRGGQPIGRAIGKAIDVAVRDTGAWMDPRSRKDWWKGR